MKKCFYIIFSFVAFSLTIVCAQNVMPTPSETQEKKTCFVTDADIDAALAESKKKSPQVYEDALRVWKNFNEKSKNPNYVYRFWARDLIVWLKTEKKIIFDSESKVADVFKKLYDRKLISDYAVITLTRDCWAYLIHLEGVPGWEHQTHEPKSHIRREYAA